VKVVLVLLPAGRQLLAPKSWVVWDCSLILAGMPLPRLSTATRPIAQKYRERTLKSTLERGSNNLKLLGGKE